MTELTYGVHAVQALLCTQAQQMQELFVQQGRKDQRIQEILNLAAQHDCVVTQVPRAQLDEMVNAANHQGIIATHAASLHYDESDLQGLLEELGPQALFLVLDRVQDPHNLGACLRSADAAGVSALIIPKKQAVQVNATVRKIACGAAQTVPVFAVTNLVRSLKAMQQAGVWVYGASMQATQTLYQTDLSGPVALVLGAEGEGLRELTIKTCDGLFAIPMCGTVASLNVSVAAGIALFEARRQRDR